MNAFDKYLEFEKKINKLEELGKWEEAEKMTDKQIFLRNENFTKEDWLKLIEDAKGSKRAVFEYTLMMKERFPE